MSRGLGCLQRRILASLRQYGHRGPFDSVLIATLAAGKIGITDSQWRSTRRALRGLEQAGLIVTAGERLGRKLWRLAEARPTMPEGTLKDVSNLLTQ